MLEARAELLPLIVEPPEPPVEPSGGALEEGAAQPGMAFQNSAGRHARAGPHQLDRIANGVSDRVEVGVSHVAAPGVVLQRAVPGRMKSDRHLGILQGAPKRIAGPAVKMLTVC